MKLSELAKQVGGTMSGADPDITGIAGMSEAGETEITFAAGSQFLKNLERSRAGAALVPPDAPDQRIPVIRVRNPRLAFARILDIFHPMPKQAAGISERAAVGRDVEIGTDCSIHPFAVLSDRVKLGSRVVLMPGVFVGEGSTIGDDTVIYANVSIGSGVGIGKRCIIHAGTVLGSDGFGFVTDGGRHHKIPQVGGVVVEDDVEIGANCTIDRATLGNTVIKTGTKIDNLVHIAHNVTIGEHCLLAGQAGVAGSTTLGKYVVLGGQAGVADHVTVGDGVMAGGGTAITKDTAPGQIIAGYNAMPLRDWLKVQVILPKLPELKKLLTQLEKQVQELKQKAG